MSIKYCNYMLDISKFKSRKKEKIPKNDLQISCHNRVLTQSTTIVCRVYGLTSIESCKNCESKNKG